MPERISLEGKVAVVTGAGRGLGRAYVELLAERGARLVVNDLGTDVSGFGKDATMAGQVADLIRSRGGEAIANNSDVSTPEGGSDLVATTIEHFGRIDLLVNNAGICGSQLFEDATLDDFDHYWRVHLGGPVNTVKAAWPHMVAQRYGKIILVTSVSGLFGLRGQATYAAAKCAVVGLMRILAIEGAEHGILVNTISPIAYTRMHPAAGSRTAEAEGRASEPVEPVASAIVWLASDGCSETNRIYNVEGGAIQRIAIVMGPGFYDPHLRSTASPNPVRSSPGSAQDIDRSRTFLGAARSGQPAVLGQPPAPPRAPTSRSTRWLELHHQAARVRGSPDGAIGAGSVRGQGLAGHDKLDTATFQVLARAVASPVAERNRRVCLWRVCLWKDAEQRD